MWPGLLRSLRNFGANMVEMYDFWTCHESTKGQYNFEDRYDIVQFIKAAHKEGLYVLLRIGPFVNAEWNYGGLPTWLKFVGNITFRTYNPQFMSAMQGWVTKLVGILKKEGLFYPQGGPIVAAQIENEYGLQEEEYGEDGKKYVKWTVELAKSFDVGVPWIMCFQEDAPADVINTCNGFYCDTWIENHKKKFPNQPSWFTENWSGWFQKWGEPRPTRPAQDMAFSVLRWYARGGTMMNYYMFHGGNSYGRLGGGPGFVTNYAFDAMVDEFGRINNPKYGHLRDLNKVLSQHEQAILAQEPVFTQLEPNVEVHVYGTLGSPSCVAFLSNVDSSQGKTVHFNSHVYSLPAWSVSILSRCTEQVYNSATVKAGHLDKSAKTGLETLHTEMKRGWVDEPIASAVPPQYFRSPKEQLLVTRDSTDYLWYSVVYVDKGEKRKCLLELGDVKDLAHVFVNKQFVGTTTSKLTVEVQGRVEIDVLCMTLGLINFGSFFEKYTRGLLGKVKLCGVDITETMWKHVPGLKGEASRYFEPAVANRLQWNATISVSKNRPLTWFAVKFNLNSELLEGIDMSGMGKGYVWLNGKNVGRYSLEVGKGKCEVCDYRGVYHENKCRVDCGVPSQRYYHVPPEWSVAGENLLVAG